VEKGRWSKERATNEFPAAVIGVYTLFKARACLRDLPHCQDRKKMGYGIEQSP
jgi:hypothetical protein